jgi:bifunctional non-homologous end joining protein LigD
LRGKEAPLVAAPRTWAEIERGADKPETLKQLNMADVLARLETDGDVFATTFSLQT